MKLLNKNIIITVFVFSFIILSTFFGLSVKAAYVSNSLSVRYVHNLDTESTYETSLIYEVDCEQRFSKNNIFGKIYVNPVFKYNIDTENEDFSIKEGYLDLYLPNFDLRIGKQKLTWGKSDGVVVTNIVNPRDYNVHPVINYSDQFQNVEAIKANFYPNNNNLEVVWIPEFKSAEMNPSIIKSQLPSGFAKDVSKKEVVSDFENSELFIRYSSIGQKYDYELMTGYSWEDEPTIHKDFLNKKVIPQHHRLFTLGGGVSTMYGPFVFKGEGIYISGEHYNIEEPLLQLNDYTEGIIEKKEIKWLAGLDYNFESYLLSFQFLQQAILDYTDNILEDKYRNQVTFLIKKDFMRSKLSSEVAFHYNVNEDILITKSTVSYDYSDQINFKAGANINLEGESFKNDVIYLQTEYLF